MSPIFEEEGKLTVENLLDLRKRNSCQECGGMLNVFMDGDTGKVFLACNDWHRTHHEGIERERSRYEKEGLASLNIKTRREIMEQAHGEEKTRALGRYMGGGVVMTKSIATEIVETLWGDAPRIEKTKCILLCQTYQLNPLMKHIYLIGYKRYKDKKLVVDDRGNPIIDWSIQQGIGATRLLAQRKHHFSYLDMTPRKATKAEIEKILGDTADPNCIYGFVWIKDVDNGAEAFGLRGIEKNANIKGTEKGNTHLNMACIRAERLALDRQYPGEMPQDIEVVDERFEVDVPDVGKVSLATGEITEPADMVEGEFSEVKGEPKRGEASLTEPIEGAKPLQKEHWCQEHNCKFDKKHTYGKDHWSHRLPDGKWCNEKKKNEKEAVSHATAEEPEPEFRDSTEAKPTDTPDEPEPEPEPEPATGTLQELQENMALCNWSYGEVGKYCNTDRGWGITSLSDLKPDQLAEVIAHIKSNPK